MYLTCSGEVSSGQRVTMGRVTGAAVTVTNITQQCGLSSEFFPLSHVVDTSLVHWRRLLNDCSYCGTIQTRLTVSSLLISRRLLELNMTSSPLSNLLYIIIGVWTADTLLATRGLCVT